MRRRANRPDNAAESVLPKAVTHEANGTPIQRTIALPLKLDPKDYPDVSHLITEDGKPVDSIFVEKEYMLLKDPLLTSWTLPAGVTSFVTLTNVGLFYVPRNPAWVPDFLLSLGVAYPENLDIKEYLSYFVWVFGKGPDVVGEIVSDRRGGEETRKLKAYAKLGIPYYFIHDPRNLLKHGVLRVFHLDGGVYRLDPANWLPDIGLGLTLWDGIFAQFERRWLRWCDKDGRVLLTGAERAEQEKRRADENAEAIKRLQAQLRALSIEPSV